MLYSIPKGITCTHCVLHWYWTSANFCNPPGLVSFFTGPRRPKRWGKCKSGAGAMGGFNVKTATCGKEFPEEFYLCSDVRVIGKNGSKKNPIEALEIGWVSKGKFVAIKKIQGMSSNLSIGRFERINFRARVKWPVTKAEFFIEDKGKKRRVSRWNVQPFHMFCEENRQIPGKWDNPIMDRKFRVSFRADGFEVGGVLTLRE